MVEFDPVLGAILVGLIGLLLWIVTNWHIKRVRTEIDEKRAETQDFVRSQLEDLKAGLKEDLAAEGQTIQIDAGPLMAQVQAELIPAVQERIETLKSTLLGKMGYAVKGVKALGEGVAELVGEQVLEESGLEYEWEMRLARFGLDEEWMKKNKAAAFGLSILKEMSGQGGGSAVQSRIVGGVPVGAKRVGPPAGFK